MNLINLNINFLKPNIIYFNLINEKYLIMKYKFNIFLNIKFLLYNFNIENNYL